MSDTATTHRKADAVRAIYGSKFNGRAAGDEAEFNLGHWETMQIQIALQDRVRALRRDAETARTEARRVIDACDDANLNHPPHVAELLDHAANLENAAYAVSEIDHRMFAHATHVTVTRFDHSD